MPDTVPTSVKRVLNILSESIFVMALVLVILLVSIGTLSRMNRLANVAQYLPVETDAFVVVNLDDYLMEPNAILTDFYEQDLKSIEWFGRDVALAWMDEEMVKFIEVNSRPQAERFMEELLIEDEVFIDHADYNCYSVAQPDCYTFRGNYLVLGLPSALELLEPGLESSISYQNVRHRLPYNSSLFAYVDTMSVRQNFLTSLGELSVWEPGYLESILHIFPVYGVSLEIDGEDWKSESFVSVDKSALNDQAFFHPSIKFNAELMPYAPDGMQFEWSGVEMATLIETLESHLEELNPAAALVFEENLNSYWAQYFGDSTLADYESILDQEHMLAWNPGEDFVFLLKMEKENLAQVEDLKDQFLANYEVSRSHFNEKGETMASIDSLSISTAEYNRNEYFEIGPSGEITHYLALFDEVLILSNDENYFYETLDRWNGRIETRDLNDLMPMLLGTDFAMSLDMTSLPESHIINLLLPGVETWTSSTKLFDDGIYIRSHLSY